MMADRFIALMPMKHHSERVPGKNYRNFAGKPLFHHVLETLLSSEGIDQILINTDSESIASDPIVQQERIRIVERPAHLCGDTVPMNALIEHDMELCEGELFLQTHSTNPLLRAATVEKAIRNFGEGSHQAAFSVTKLQTRLWDEQTKPVNHDPKILLRTQDLPPLFEENSCLYLFSRSSFAESGSRLGRSPAMFEMPAGEAIDIDNEIDFKIAEMMMKYELDKS